jgi:UDP-glucose 4-epimerase
LANAHVLAVDYLMEDKGNLIVNLGSENGISVQQIVDTAREITGHPIPAEYVERRKGDPAKLIASSKEAKKILGWKAEHSSVENIIASTWRVYLANQKRLDD